MDLHTRHAEPIQHLIQAVLTSPGATDPTLRHTIEEHTTHITLHEPQTEEPLPPPLASYIQKVALAAYKTTDEDIATLQQAGFAEDAIFEITVTTALAAGLTRLERGLTALKGTPDAPQTH